MKKNRIVIFAIFILAVLLISGCETAKGALGGAKKDLQSAQEADEWMRKNLW